MSEPSATPSTSEPDAQAEPESPPAESPAPAPAPLEVEPAPALLEVEQWRAESASQILLDGLSFRLREGEHLGLLAPDGTGAALFERLLGVVAPPSAPARAAVLELDPARQALEIRRQVGYVPAAPAFYEHMNPVSVGRFLAGLYPGWIEGRFRQLLTQLGLPTWSTLADLAPGARARLALAAALGHAPRLLLVDVPQGLDDLERDRFLSALGDAATRTPSLLLVSSRPAELRRRCDRLLVLSGGRLVAAGPPAELVARHRVLLLTRDAPADLASRLPTSVRPIRRQAVRAGARLVAELANPTQPPQLTHLPGVLGWEPLELEELCLALSVPPVDPPRVKRRSLRDRLFGEASFAARYRPPVEPTPAPEPEAGEPAPPGTQQTSPPERNGEGR